MGVGKKGSAGEDPGLNTGSGRVTKLRRGDTIVVTIVLG